MRRTEDPQERCRKNRRLNQFETDNRLERVLSYPLTVYFESTRRCNLTCFMCPHTFQQVDQHDAEPQLLDKLIDWLQTCDMFWFNGLGETLLREDFPQLLAKLPCWMPVSLYTNGTLLDDATRRLVVQRPLERMRVSIDSMNDDLYQSIRGARLLASVRRNLKELQQLKAARGQEKPRVEIAMTVMRRNVHELPAMIELAAELGASTLALARFTAFRREVADESMWWQKEQYNQAIIQAQSVADRLGIELDHPGLFVEDDQINGVQQADRRHCLEPWNFLYIMNTGHVNGCTMPAPVLGDLHRQSMAEIWNGKGFRAWRTIVNTNANTIEFCTRCPHHHNQCADNPQQMFVYLDEIQQWEPIPQTASS